MSRPQDSAKRERIIAAAFHTFGEVGFSNATIKDIAARADIAPGTVYTYFSDKRDLFRYTVQSAWTELHAELDAIRKSSGSYDEKLSRLRRTGLALLKRMHPILNGMFSEAVRMDLFNDNLDRFLDRLEELYLEGLNRGEVHELQDHHQRRFLLRTIACGLILQISIVEAEHLDAEIERLHEDLERNERAWLNMNRLIGGRT
ncbi:MAG: TetR/AcrR family transcriptional regulator [Spirochaetaceae bacterium]